METIETIKPLLLQKEQIEELSFGSNDVLTTPEARHERANQLIKAMTLGNSREHVKVTLVFSAKQGYFRVETTVWAVGDTTVQLKSGMFIPIRAIHYVIF